VIDVQDDCVTDIKFEAKSGLVIEGKFDPPTSGVHVTIINKSNG
jgi:hypothetical protein